MRRGRGCAGERRGRAEEAERGGRNGAEGGEVRHGVFAPVGRFCWVGLGVRVGGRSTAQKMKDGSEKKDENSKNSTEKADFVVFFVKMCRLFLVFERGCRFEAFLRVVARCHQKGKLDGMTQKTKQEGANCVRMILIWTA